MGYSGAVLAVSTIMTTAAAAIAPPAITAPASAANVDRGGSHIVGIIGGRRLIDHRRRRTIAKRIDADVEIYPGACR